MPLFEKRKPVVLRTGTLTTAFAGDDALAGADVSNESRATLYITYAIGTSGEGVDVFPEVQIAGDATWYPAATILSAGTAADGVLPNELLAATYQTVGPRAVEVDLPGATKLRVRCLELGSPSGAGSCTVTMVASRVAT